jgi:hypothetical protein
MEIIMNTIKSVKLFLVAVAALAVTPAQATVINWGTYPPGGSANPLYDSNGVALDNNFFFELGSFGGFVPDSTNLASWVTNWKPFDRASAPALNGWNPATGNLGHAATLDPDLTTSNLSLSQANTFALGELAYVWIYKDVAGNPSPLPVYGNGMQWALVTNNSGDGDPSDDWRFPEATGHVTGSVTWQMENATSSPFGGQNGVQGPGTYTPPVGGFIAQTHTIVPEPGAILLALGALGLTSLRRRRSS